MVMRHRSKIDGLACSSERMFQILFDKGELALGLERQGLSVELVPLPDLWRSGHGNHEIDRLFAIGFGSSVIASQGIDTSAQCRVKTGRADSLTRVATLELTPFVFQRQNVIP